VDVQTAHPDNSARDTTEIEKDSRRVQEAPGTVARISPLRRVPLQFITRTAPIVSRFCGFGAEVSEKVSALEFSS
jgi:hypothetical protein